ncbi:MAG: phosphoglucosamine mutase, partial [Planctomycetes bacterium]|nr:phosphoglucosamine mutase [Planctomycetota bacterium]
MAEELIISISGMRGIIGENLSASVATDYGSAFGTFLKANYKKDDKLTVCIGRDSRPSGQMLESAVAAGLCAVGVDVVVLGLVITPSVGVMLRQLSCAGGVMITASHNPLPYNGIKLILDNGVAPSLVQTAKIKEIYFAREFDYADSPSKGRIVYNEDSYSVHIDRVFATIDVGAIADKKFKVVLDSVNGAGGPITKQMLGKLGCEVYAVNDEPTGIFAHTPEPTEKNLTGLCDIVKQQKADIGLAQDPDADRLAIVDENGVYIGEEYTLALAAKNVFSKTKGKAATNLSTSRMIDDLASEFGCEVLRTAVGEANVAGAMLANDCVIGGEGNGGVIDLRVGPIRDSLVGIALVLQLMAETGKTVSQLVNEIGGYAMIKEKFPADKNKAAIIMDQAKQMFADAKIDTSDGCRFDLDDGWVHLRISNTEPVMRVIAEAKEKDVARKYVDDILALVPLRVQDVR